MQRILRLPRTDRPSTHLLLNVARHDPHSLDLKLIGTDKEHLYHGSVKESNVKSLQATTFGGNLAEWKLTLAYALLHEQPEGPLPDSLQGVEVVAAIIGTTVTLTLRKNIAGITQKLGSVKLQQDDEREQVNFLDWLDHTVATSDDLRVQLQTLRGTGTSYQERLAALTSDLNNLVMAKKEHEDELLAKFAALLNAKKLKIRDQQRLLANAKIDPDIANNISDARTLTRHNGMKLGGSERGKRNADAMGASEEDEESGADEDAPIENGNMDEDDGEGSRRQETPGTDDFDLIEDSHPSPQPGAFNGETSPPPQRELPSRGANPVSREPDHPQASTAVDDDDDDETDDEL